MKKRLVSLMLVLSLVLGSMSMGFAAGKLTEGIEDAKVVSAVERLAAFGIVEGFEDGMYHPELKVTREQFAKVLVESLGLGTAANAARGATNFGDVEAGRWSDGYVNVASGQGLIKGYPDGTFGPAKEVTYAEALTMLVRALGYKDEFLPGTWPGNYVAKAAGLGITSGVNFSADSATADRGAVAVMVNNTLDAKVVKVSEFSGDGIKYTETEFTLLEDKLEVDKYDSLRLVENQRVNDTLDSNELVFKALSKKYEDSKIIGQNVDADKNTDAIEVAVGVDKENLLGMKVKIYVNDDDEIVYMEKDGNEKAVIDQIDEVDGDTLSLYVLDDEYDVTNDSTTYVNGDSKGAFDEGQFGRFIVSGSDIVFADVYEADETENTGMVVTEIDKTNKELTGVVGAGLGDPDDEFVVDLEDDFDEMLVMNAKTRAAMTFDDIAAEDVVYVTLQDIDGDDYAIVQVVKDNKVEGELGKYKADEAVIGDKTYDLTKRGNTVYSTFSINSNDDIYSYAAKFADDADTIKDAYGENVTALTDVVGRVIHFTTDAEATSGWMYGVVDKFYDGTERVRMYVASEDKLVTYTFEEDANGKLTDVGKFAKFKLNKDGEIAEDKYEVIANEEANIYTVNAEFGKDTIKTVEGKTFTVDEANSIFVNAPDAKGYPVDLEDQDLDDCEIVKWADIADDDVNETTQFVVFADKNNEIDAVLFFTGLESTSDEEAAYIVDTFRQNGDEAAEVDFFGGAVEEIVVDGASEDNAKPEMIAVVKKQSDGELQIVKAIGFNEDDTTGDFIIVKGTVSDKSGDFFKIGTETYKLSTATIVYDEDDKKSKSNVSDGKYVEMVVEDGVNVRVVKLTDAPAVPAAVTSVINTINALPAPASMTLANEAAVVAARTAYDALTVEQKAQVTNLATLTAAEAKIAELKAPMVSLVKGTVTQVAGVDFFAVTCTFTNVAGAAEYDVTFTTTDAGADVPQTTTKFAVGTPTSEIFPNAGTKLTVKVYNATGTLLETFENVSF